MPLLTTGAGGSAVDNRTWQQTYADVLGGEQAGLTGWSLRTVIPAASISLSGSTIRVSFGGTQSIGSIVVDNVSIVERSGSTENGTTAPTELLFSGVSGYTVAQGGTVTSDSLSFALDETKSYLVICDVNNTTGAIARDDSSGHDFYFAAATDSYNVQSPAGFTFAAGSSVNVTKVEVFA